MARYRVSRWSSPWEWSIHSVPDDTPLGQIGDKHPEYVVATFGEAKKWLAEQTKAWTSGFLDDAREIRALRVRDIDPATEVDLALDTRRRRDAGREALKSEDGR